MQIERYTELSDDEIKERIAQNKWTASDLQRRAHILNVEIGSYKVELDRRAVERLPLFEGDKVMKSDGSISTVEHIGNYSGGLEYVIAVIDNKHLGIDEVMAMRRAYLEAYPNESEAHDDAR